MPLFYLAIAIAIFGVVVVVYGGLHVRRGRRARGVILVLLGLLLIGGSVGVHVAEQHRRELERQRKEQASQPEIVPYPDD